MREKNNKAKFIRQFEILSDELFKTVPKSKEDTF